MRKARHIDILNRLETTRRLGLVENYQIDWKDKLLCGPQVTVQAQPAFPVQVTKNYIASLLEELVPAREIIVTRDPRNR